MKNAITVLAWLLLAAPLLAQSADIQSLPSSGSTSGEIHDQQARRYGIDLRGGDFLELSVSQDAAPIRVTMVGPDGTPVRTASLVGVPPLDAQFLFIADATGAYRVDLELTELQTTPAQYTLSVLAHRAATEGDRARDRCFSTLVDADRLAHIERLDTFGQAIEQLQQAVACWKEIDDVALEKASLTSLGALASLFAQSSGVAAVTYERLANLYAAEGDTERRLAILVDTVREYEDDGRFDRARDIARLMREIAIGVGDRQREAYAVSHLAFTELSLGNYRYAREEAANASTIALEVENESVQAFALVTLAHLDELAGDDDAARARYDRISRLNPNGRYNRSVLPIELGFLHLRNGEYDLAAARFNERLAGASTNVQRDQESLARIGLGDIRLRRGDRTGARALYEQASATLARGNTRHRCVGLARVGRLDLEDDRLDEAQAAFTEMLSLAARMLYPPCEAQGRFGLAAVALRRGDLAAADDNAQRVVELTETFREAVPSLESRALGFGVLAPAFEQAVDISMRLAARGDASASVRAFELNERALARGLLDRISTAALDDRAGIPETLAQERQRLRDQWRSRLAQLQVASSGQETGDHAKPLRSEIQALEVQMHDIDARVDASDAEHSSLISPAPLGLARIQSLLDADTQLIEYALGEHQSFVWVVSATGLHAVPLAPRATIEAAARIVHQDLTSAYDAQTALARRRRLALSDLILTPIAGFLHAARVVVVATGGLSLVPFGALPIPSVSPRQPMQSRYEIVHAPSATTLAALRTVGLQRTRATKSAIVLADPIFVRGDERVTSTDGPVASLDTAARTTASLGQRFARLHYSREEAEAISAMMPGQVTTLMDGDATRERVLGAALADYRIVHFATHAIVDPEITSLSSIVLSLVDDRGGARDPFVRLSDIYDMRLNADLVVLSACSTAAGKDVPGEGPIGLARAFMYAGAPRVVASLWEVNDHATAELMKRFYQGMLIDRLPAAAALRSAQQQLAAIPRWRSPYYWAGFVLQGEWR